MNGSGSVAFYGITVIVVQKYDIKYDLTHNLTFIHAEQCKRHFNGATAD